MKNPLRQFMYVSCAIKIPTTKEIDHLVAGARYFNATHDVTGFLLHEEGTFMQVLEGLYDDVEGALTRIHNDPTHKDIHVLFDMEMQVREFSKWVMGCREVSTLDTDTVKNYHLLVCKSPELYTDMGGNAEIGLSIMRSAARGTSTY